MATTKTAKAVPAKKAVAKKTVAKKATAKRTPRQQVKVKSIQTVDTPLGGDTTVFFTDGTKAVIEAGNKLAQMLTQPDNVAPNLIAVTLQGKNIVEAERVEIDTH